MLPPLEKLAVYPISKDRDIAITAIETCRLHADQSLRDQPCDLAAMLIEQAHQLWTDAMTNLHRLGFVTEDYTV
jgi:hypothetical protein